MKPTKTLNKTNQLLLPTLFDRLMDTAPQRKVESMQEYVMDIREIKAIIQRDLGYLFNAMNQQKLIDFEQFPHLQSSTLNFGMDPMEGTYHTKVHWPTVSARIKYIIEKYEPRLSKVHISSGVEQEGESRTANILDFQITGEINIQPYPVEFIVQSSIDLESSRMFIKSTSVR